MSNIDLDYKPNSKKSKREAKDAATEKKVSKVIQGTVKTKKRKSSGLKEAFISEDAKNVKSYVFMDVLIPAMKKAFSDIVKDGIDMILYGETRKKSSSNASYVSYRSYSDKDRYRSDERRYDRRRPVYEWEDIILETRGEAEDVLDTMNDLLETYDMVSVADLYDLVGIRGEHTDNKYGWTNLRTAEPVRVRDGYLLRLPKPGPL